MHLAAPMPPARINSRGLMDLRVARKIAALSGIPGDPSASDDAGRGRAWLADYRQLSTTEITLGGPIVDDEHNPDGGLFLRASGGGRRFRHRDGAHIDFAPIPNVAVQRYGPDTKAALVLAGANYVLRPVVEAVRVALAEICDQVNSPGLVVAVGLCLLQEAFAAQPILIRNAVQAAQIQRALLLVPRPEPLRANPQGRPLSRIELAGSGAEAKYDQCPEHLELIRSTWDGVLDDDFYSEAGTLRPVATAKLRFKPAHGFEQNDAVATTGQPENREWALGLLEDLSEALLTGSVPGAPVSTIAIEDPPVGPPFAEVVVPRQRQVEHLMANVVRRLAPFDPREPIGPGQVLALPVLRAPAWAGRDLLTRRAVLLAHHYAVRAAGWLSGMTKLDNRRSREDCADRYRTLADAAGALLGPDDPLRDQLCAQSWGYLAQYGATFGRVERYPELIEVLERLERRVAEGRGGKAILIELLPQVLANLRTVRRAVAAGSCEGPSPRRISADLERWWTTARRLRDELLHDPDERSHLDWGYANTLLDSTSDDAALERGLALVSDVIASREANARREGRWIALRMGYLAQLRGVTEALRRWADRPPTEAYRGYGRTAFEVARALTEREEIWTFLCQRADPDQPGQASYDGNALMMLILLSQGWLAVLRHATLSEEEASTARAHGEGVTRWLRRYLDELCSAEADRRPGSRLDPHRRTLAERALAEWEAWAAAN
jgi:hypothetical protein